MAVARMVPLDGVGHERMEKLTRQLGSREHAPAGEELRSMSVGETRGRRIPARGCLS